LSGADYHYGSSGYSSSSSEYQDQDHWSDYASDADASTELTEEDLDFDYAFSSDNVNMDGTGSKIEYDYEPLFTGSGWLGGEDDNSFSAFFDRVEEEFTAAKGQWMGEADRGRRALAGSLAGHGAVVRDVRVLQAQADSKAIFDKLQKAAPSCEEDFDVRSSETRSLAKKNIPKSSFRALAVAASPSSASGESEENTSKGAKEKKKQSQT
jgi:hypothetical protein